MTATRPVPSRADREERDLGSRRAEPTRDEVAAGEHRHHAGRLVVEPGRVRVGGRVAEPLATDGGSIAIEASTTAKAMVRHLRARRGRHRLMAVPIDPWIALGPAGVRGMMALGAAVTDAPAPPAMTETLRAAGVRVVEAS